MFKNKKVILGGTVVIALAIVMAGTFAWFTDSDEVVNKMKLANFDVKITEDWKEEKWQNLEPSAEVDKAVRVTNNGTADAVVRVSVTETVQLFEAEDDELKIYWLDAPTTEDGYVAVPNYNLPEGTATKTNQAKTITYYAAITSLKDGDTQCYVAIDEDHDGLVRYNPAKKVEAEGEAEATTVEALEYAYYKYSTVTVGDLANYFTPNFDTTENWTLIEGTKGVEGQEDEADYYYYNKVLKPGKVTEPLFTKVTVSENLPNTYIGSIYTLTPNMEAVQAKAEAITGTWGLEKADFVDTWELGTTEEEPTEPEEEPTEPDVQG